MTTTFNDGNCAKRSTAIIEKLNEIRENLMKHFGYYNESWDPIIENYNLSYVDHPSYFWLILVPSQKGSWGTWTHVPSDITRRIESFKNTGECVPFESYIGNTKFMMKVGTDDSFWGYSLKINNGRYPLWYCPLA
jgi:hypothetical protein